jgi:hypothetical protein
MVMSTENPATVDASKKRKVKELPPGLEKLTESSQFWKNLKFQLETDSKEPEEVMVAYEAFFEDSPSISLDKLTLGQLRTLCKNVGCHYVNKCNKFHCQKALYGSSPIIINRGKGMAFRCRPTRIGTATTSFESPMSSSAMLSLMACLH